MEAIGEYTIEVAITAEQYDGSIHDAIVAVIGETVQREDACDLFGVEGCDGFYGEDEEIDGIGVEAEDFAIETGGTYRIGQVKSCHEDTQRAGAALSVSQLHSFEHAIQQHGGTVTAKYRVIADLEKEHVQQVESLFSAGRIEQCTLTCIVEDVELSEQLDYGHFFDTYRDGKPVIRLLIPVGFTRSAWVTVVLVSGRTVVELPESPPLKKSFRKPHL